MTSLEFDHADIYHDMADYSQAFTFLTESVPGNGNIFLYGDEEAPRALGGNEQVLASVLYYGLGERNDITVRNIAISPEGQEFNLYIDGENMGTFFITLHGKHNLLNTLAVCGMALAEGVSENALRQGLKTFKGMKRRQEIVGEANGITVLDDFAHHPTAVRETIKAIKEKFPDRRLVIFFEPRSNTSRRKIFEDDYTKAFDGADEVYLSIPPFRHNDRPEDFIDAPRVAKVITSRGPKAFVFNNATELLQYALSTIITGDVVLIMSNGSFDGIHSKLLEALGQK